MSDFKADMTHIQSMIGSAFTDTGALVALADGGTMNPEKLQQTLERTMREFERATMVLRTLAERNSPGVGSYGSRPLLPSIEVAGSVSMIDYTWLHIRLNTLLPHCRFETPTWLADTVRRLLDDYEAAGGTIPFYKNGAVLFIDEYSDITRRKIYDQDNKGWKAVSNALKGRLFPDDDQYTLGLALLSKKSSENVTHITVVDATNAGSFLDLRNGYAYVRDVYSDI